MLDLLGSRNVTLSEPAPSDGDWYLNLLWIERQKCLLLTHSGTLFSVFRAGVRVADLRPLGDYVVEAIETALRSEGLPADTFSQLDHDDVRVAKTASRHTLGFMKEMAFELEWHIANPSNSLTSTSPPAPDPGAPPDTSPVLTRPLHASRRSSAADFLNPTGCDFTWSLTMPRSRAFADEWRVRRRPCPEVSSRARADRPGLYVFSRASTRRRPDKLRTALL
jgi:hypothetical protein